MKKKKRAEMRQSVETITIQRKCNFHPEARVKERERERESKRSTLDFHGEFSGIRITERGKKRERDRKHSHGEKSVVGTEKSFEEGWVICVLLPGLIRVTRIYSGRANFTLAVRAFTIGQVALSLSFSLSLSGCLS